MLRFFFFFFFFFFLILSYNTFVVYIITKTEDNNTIAEVGAWTLAAYSWLCTDLLVLPWVS